MSSTVDKKWMKYNRRSATYLRGVRSFIDFLRTNGGILFSCPCLHCMNGKGLKTITEIDYHLRKIGINPNYTTWHCHDEESAVVGKVTNNSTTEDVGYVADNLGDGGNADHVVENIVSDEVDVGTPVVDENVGVSSKVHSHGSSRKNKKSSYECAREPLYPSCSKEKTALYAAIRLNNIKTQYGFSDNGVTALLELMKELLPDENTLPSKFPEIKKMIQEVGMDYITYDACINDCILYWKNDALRVNCSICQEPRYKKVFNDDRKLTQVAQKTLRHFPVIARLQRFYSVPWIAEAFYWHFKAKSDINVMRHPVDSSAWRCADAASPEFAKEPRNVTLGISTDGFNPNGCFGAAHSSWPVILCPYNLPPSMCMKKEFSMLCLLISGPKAPGKDIDVYLQPLIDELKQLWNEGVMTFDAFTKTEFLMKARLFWGIHDFPALGTLSGSATHGYVACPTCGEGTSSDWLPYSKKNCYMGHRRWLPANHKYRDDKTNFNGSVEHGTAPWPLTGRQVQAIVADIRSIKGKGPKPSVASKGKGPQPSVASTKRKRKAGEMNEDVVAVEVSDRSLFSRRSILHDLPNWSSNPVRHCMDVMHTEKNIMEHILNTVMGTPKSKDGFNARKDLEAMGIKRKLWVKVDKETGKTTMEHGDFELTRPEKVILCTVLKNLKVPTGFCTNLRNMVSISPPEIRNLKTHDYHVFMQHFLPLLVHIATSLPKDLRLSLLRISLYFKVLCAKVINREQLLRAKASLVESMCVLEKYFPPSFFVISIHLMVHLADEALICGPVRFRWMYPFERLMKGFKGLVRNRRYIDGCIAKGYILREASLYCMEDISIDGVGTHKHTRQAFLDDNDEFADEMPMSSATKITLTQVQYEQVRKWVLSKYVGIDEWESKYDSYVNSSKSDTQRNRPCKKTIKSFNSWLRDELLKVEEVDSVLWRLAQGPLFKAMSYNKYQVNGFVFCTQDYEARMVTQNSGVQLRDITKHRAKSTDKNFVEAEITYYGVIKKIISLNYSEFEETVFYCDWVRVEDKTNGCKVDPQSHMIKVNLSKLKSIDRAVDEPFIMASEASQVFYSTDISDKGWYVVLHSPQRLSCAVDDIEFPTIYQSALTDNAHLEKLLCVDSVV